MNIRMSTKGKRPMRSLTPSDKIHAIQRIHDGESKASVARDIGVPESTLRGWCKNEDKLRFMSRQSITDKMSADSLAEKMDVSAASLLSGPPEKRQKMDPALPLNFSNKLKYDELAYKHPTLNGLEFNSSKALNDLSFGGLPPEYATFNSTAKSKGYGADISRQNDLSMAAISPLSSLSHLSGLAGLSHSPLAISFNELTSNLNLLAQLNPGLAAMTGINGLASATNQMRNVKPKTSQMHSPCSEGSDRQQGLSVKNWAKQKSVASSSNDHGFGLNLSQTDTKSRMKCPSPSLAPSLGGNMPLPAMPEDPLLYWLKSQQAMLGLNSLYPPPPPAVAAASPPIRSSTPQQIPLASTPLTPSSTPSGSLDDKNSAWFNWCKAFGASLNSLAPAAAAAAALQPTLHQPATSTATTTVEGSNTMKTLSTASNQKQAPFENILYSHLTKETSSPSVHSTSSAENPPTSSDDIAAPNGDLNGKPEDLSAKFAKSASPRTSPLPTPAQSPADLSAEVICLERNSSHNTTRGHHKESHNEVDGDPKNAANNSADAQKGSPTEADVTAVSDSLPNSSDVSCPDNDLSHKSAEGEEHAEWVAGGDSGYEDQEAIEHGEKFLKWLESCSNPRVTAVHLTQLRLLIAAVKSGSEPVEPKTSTAESEINSTATVEAASEDAAEPGSRAKLRRRK